MITIYDKIMSDHKKIIEILRTIEDGNKEKKNLQRLEHALVMHTQIEEEYFYIPVKDLLGEAMSSIIEVSNQEHRVINTILNAMINFEGYFKPLPILFKSLKHHLEFHIYKEENEIIPLAKQYLSESTAAEMASRMIAAEENFGQIRPIEDT